MISPKPPGTSSAAGGSGSVSTAIATLTKLCPPNGARPVASSNSVTPETVDVGAGIGWLAEQDFGRHVDRRADDLIARLAMRFRELFAGNRQPLDERGRITAGDRDVRAERKAEVEHLDASAGRDANVGRLQIAMHHAVGVGLAERIAQLQPDLHDAIDRQRTVAELRRQRLAGHVLHDDVRTAVLVEHVVHRRDVGVIQRGGHRRFAQQMGDRASGVVSAGSETRLSATRRPSRGSSAR